MLREFVTSGYDLSTRTEQGCTALILTAYHGQPVGRRAAEDDGAAGVEPLNQG